MTFYTVKPENEPTEELARQYASDQWSRWMKNSTIFTEDGREEFVEDEWENWLEELRRRNGDPLDTVEYNVDAYDFGDVMTVPEFLDNVEAGGFIDYDGSGYPMKDGKVALHPIYPSIVHLIPRDATHIIWFNR
jgi:hypothetical protein